MIPRKGHSTPKGVETHRLRTTGLEAPGKRGLLFLKFKRNRYKAAFVLLDVWVRHHAVSVLSLDISRCRTVLRLKPYPLLHLKDRRWRQRKAPLCLCARDLASLVAVRVELGCSSLQSAMLQLLCKGDLQDLAAQTLKALTVYLCVCLSLLISL